MTALDFAIIDEIAPPGLPAQDLRASLNQRGYQLSTPRLYERLVHLEATGRVRVHVKHNAAQRTWEAA